MARGRWRTAVRGGMRGVAMMLCDGNGTLPSIRIPQVAVLHMCRSITPICRQGRIRQPTTAAPDQVTDFQNHIFNRNGSMGTCVNHSIHWHWETAGVPGRVVGICHACKHNAARVGCLPRPAQGICQVVGVGQIMVVAGIPWKDGGFSGWRWGAVWQATCSCQKSFVVHDVASSGGDNS